ncbi:hypothetical protein [Rhizobium sp. SYY.PMSO]|uniref:hypothetical protein n=1 Tax=Rhizobium sp. SYY.PMSO TaxID=3382192 RepID=UPI0039902A8F
MRLLLDPVEVREEFSRANGIKQQEFNDRFRLHHPEGSQFFYSKFFVQARERSPTSQREFDVVTRDSFELFQQEHVSLASLAKGRGRTIDVKNALDQASILPVWELKGRRTLTFYRRCDAEKFLQSRLNLKNIRNLGPGIRLSGLFLHSTRP